MRLNSDNLQINRKGKGWRKACKARFINVLSRSGSVTLATKLAGINRDTAYAWRTNDMAFADKWVSISDQRMDLAYDMMDLAVRKGNMRAIVWTLKKFRPEVFKY